jgi:hypothetical protein
VDANDYSVHPSVVGRRVEVAAGLDTVTVRCAGRVVAEHQRCLAKHQTITDPAHRAAAEMLRELPRTKSTGPEQAVEQRSLSDYDAAFGLADEAVA